MRKEDREYLDQRLATLDSNERQRLFKRAAAVRQTEKDIHRRRVSRRDDDWQSGGMVPRAAATSLDDRVLALLRAEDARPTAEEVPGTDTHTGTVVWLGSKTCVVRYARGDIECQLNSMGTLAVGDQVTLHVHGTTARVAAVHPRRTVLSRPDPHNPHMERVIAANVDIVVIVVSVGSPPLHPRVIDRYLVAVQRGGATAAICVNKIDLVSAEVRAATMTLLAPYLGNGIPALLCSTTSGEGIDALMDLVRTRLCAFVGHSGVGKSSLTNALQPDVSARAGDVSEAHGKGTHTTTASTLYQLADDTRVIDTPGIRSFGLWKITAEELRWYFPEFDLPRPSCRFGDCTHSHEPNCGVRAAVAAGLISAGRHDTYLRMLASLRAEGG